MFLKWPEITNIYIQNSHISQYAWFIKLNLIHKKHKHHYPVVGIASSRTPSARQ